MVPTLRPAGASQTDVVTLVVGLRQGSEQPGREVV